MLDLSLPFLDSEAERTDQPLERKRGCLGDQNGGRGDERRAFWVEGTWDRCWRERGLGGRMLHAVCEFGIGTFEI